VLKKYWNILLNYFSKQPNSQTNADVGDEDVLASITYYIKRNSDDVVIDAEMFDYEDESILGMCTILDILSQEASYVETVNMIRSSLLEGEEQDVLLKILTNVSQQARTKLVNAQRESQKDEPCIKPSDMI
jgi:hypothetical protein